MNRLHVFLAGMGYGLLMRLLFGLMTVLPAGGTRLAQLASGPMTFAFVVLVPFALGVLTVYWQPPERRGLGDSLLWPVVSVSLFALGTGVLLIEGSICIIMALPLFWMISALGGLLAWAVLRDWRPHPGVMSMFALAPLAIGMVERNIALPMPEDRVTRIVHVDAAPETIWRLINHATAITPDEMADGLAYRIGLPFPIEAITVEEGSQRIRKLRWQKGIAFDEPITAWEENRHVAWRYNFDANTFPPDTLDEHVVIGGAHFDLIDTAYTLQPKDGGTDLRIDVTYRVSTHFNTYARWWGRLLVSDAAETILEFYQHRAERIEQ